MPPYEAPQGSLRRLTRSQFKNAIESVFGVKVDAGQLDPDSFDGHFSVVGAATVVTSQVGVERYHEAIEGAVDSVFSSENSRTDFVGCVPTSADDACARSFLERLGRRAYRRDLAANELSDLVGVAQTAATELEDVYEGMRWATVALFSSPSFLYRPELGRDPTSPVSRLTSYEIASRLAFLIWNTQPDEELLDDAAAGRLETKEGIVAAAERMLDAPGGHEAAGAFAEDYMRVDRIATQAKDQALYPAYGPALQKAMVRDMRAVWELVALEKNADLLTLFSTPQVVVNAELAALYGLDPSGLDSDTFEVRTLPSGSVQAGILGKPAFLSQFANQKEGSPTLRGKFIREAITCTPVEPPPGNVALELPESSADRPTTKRERLEQHRQLEVCAECHAKMDPLGLPFESFDAIGRFRELDNGLPVDPSGEFEGIAVSNASELGQVMSASELVSNCLVQQYYSYATGHPVRDVDAIVVQSLATSFASSGRRLRNLLLDIVTNDTFTQVARQNP